MKILWFTWKDMKNPLAGGAEAVNENLAKKLVENGHEVIFLVAGFTGGLLQEKINGYTVIRLGNKWTIYWKAFRYYRKNLIGWADLAIDEMNTVPFFTKFYVKEKNIILSYQLCREVWFYQMFFPLSLIGFLVEPLYLWLIRDKIVLTESESAKEDFQKYGFKKDNIFIFPVGLDLDLITEDEFLNQKKELEPTILYIGSLRKMKRPFHVLKAFEYAKKNIPNLKLFIAGFGDTAYSKKFIAKIKRSKFSSDISYFGRISKEKKVDLMRKSHIICATSVKEGWGMVITEANSQGTPAIVYDVDGLRDACKNNFTGLVTRKNPYDLSKKIIELLGDINRYEKLRYNSWQDSSSYTSKRSYEVFIGIIKSL